jgi:hypothetical protein
LTIDAIPNEMDADIDMLHFVVVRVKHCART